MHAYTVTTLTVPQTPTLNAQPGVKSLCCACTMYHHSRECRQDLQLTHDPFYDQQCWALASSACWSATASPRASAWPRMSSCRQHQSPPPLCRLQQVIPPMGPVNWISTEPCMQCRAMHTQQSGAGYMQETVNSMTVCSLKGFGRGQHVLGSPAEQERPCRTSDNSW